MTVDAPTPPSPEKHSSHRFAFTPPRTTKASPECNIEPVVAEILLRESLERRRCGVAEDPARDRPNLPLLDAVQLVRLYAERGSPKLEGAVHLVAVRIRLGNWDTSGTHVANSPNKNPRFTGVL